ncbi:MAG: hypothetical protein WBZ36_11655 [Candidatus Nitrosopolaris sp.]
MEEQEQDHTADCIENKFLIAVDAQLDRLLALVENGMFVHDFILNKMFDIIVQEEENMKKDEKD